MMNHTFKLSLFHNRCQVCEKSSKEHPLTEEQLRELRIMANGSEPGTVTLDAWELNMLLDHIGNQASPH